MLDDFERVAFVRLAALRDPALVIPAIAEALDVREAPDRSLVELIQDAIGNRRVLLVLDNVEQVVEAATDLWPLLDECPRLTILATSRILLRISGEQAFPVPPLTIITHGGRATARDVAASEAGMLFTSRALAANLSFAVTDANADDIVAICKRLDGLPLAIELAAARSNILPPAALLARLDPLLAGPHRRRADVPVRQQTMRDAIAWSYDLLRRDGAPPLPPALHLCRRLQPGRGRGSQRSGDRGERTRRPKTPNYPLIPYPLIPFCPRRGCLADGQEPAAAGGRARGPAPLRDAGDDPGVRARAPRRDG